MAIGGVLSLVHVALALMLAPFLLSVINRTKAFYAGRRGEAGWQSVNPNDATQLLSLSYLHAAMTGQAWLSAGLVVPLVAAAWWVVLLAETSRIPVDDPTTHLELTMIHEVMVLDHSGPDFAFITYTAALKLWLFGGLLVGLLFPLGVGVPALNSAIAVAAMLAAAVAIGVVEATIARLRLPRMPQLLLRAVRTARVERLGRPPVGYSASILIGVALLTGCLWGSRYGGIRLPHEGANPLELPVAGFIILAGLFMIVARNNAINQVLGY